MATGDRCSRNKRSSHCLPAHSTPFCGIFKPHARRRLSDTPQSPRAAAFACLGNPRHPLPSISYRFLSSRLRFSYFFPLEYRGDRVGITIVFLSRIIGASHPAFGGVRCRRLPDASRHGRLPHSAALNTMPPDLEAFRFSAQ